MRTDSSNGKAETEVPPFIGIRTAEFEPLLAKWRANNPGVPWTHVLRSALRGESPLPALAGKRHAHLVNGKAVAA